MDDIQVRELKEALLAVLSTAASIGIDIDILCQLATDELLSGRNSSCGNLYAAGAVYQLGTCMGRVLEPIESASSDVFLVPL
ncbi:hypothetical protein [Pseudomonas sp. CFII64]|uniref:hypothetical protein n=1 Tax=Pseudomonas sp. CFII64 TaxID=911242 RepID=UPI0012EBD32C|nr:hypothetical protein [Pseudomonas sp. CFII64]